MTQFTTVVGIDHKHFEQLKLVWATWLLHRPEIMRNPILFVCDEDQEPWSHWNEAVRAEFGHSQTNVVTWRQDASQREKMLTALTFAPLDIVRTNHFLKIDTDTYATNHDDNWLDPKYFNSDLCGPRWGYSKPDDIINRLNSWAKEKNLPGDPMEAVVSGGRAWHKRIAGYVVSIRTKWARGVFTKELFGDRGRLPVPSWDTTIWYMAHRFSASVNRNSPKKFGWQHRRTMKRIKQCTQEVLSGV